MHAECMVVQPSRGVIRALVRSSSPLRTPATDVPSPDSGQLHELWRTSSCGLATCALLDTKCKSTAKAGQPRQPRALSTLACRTRATSRVKACMHDTRARQFGLRAACQLVRLFLHPFQYIIVSRAARWARSTGPPGPPRTSAWHERGETRASERAAGHRVRESPEGGSETREYIPVLVRELGRARARVEHLVVEAARGRTTMAGDYYGDYTRVREPTDFRVLADARLADAGAPASKPVSSLPTWLGLG